MIFRSEDGTLIYCESHRVARARGAMLIVHGLGEHCGRYGDVIKACRQLSLDVHLFDLRGHGRSQGTRGHFRSMDELHRDMDAWLDHLVAKGELKSELPLFLLGHSLGGLVAATFAAQYVAKPLFPELKGLILSAPAFGLRPGFFRALEKRLARRLPPFMRTLQIPTGIAAKDLSHDKDEVRLYEEDPLVHPWITPAAYLAMERGIRSLRKLMPKMQRKTLFLLSGKDKIVHTDAAEAFARKLSIAHPGMVEVRVFHSFFHEPFHEAKRKLAFLELKKWVLQCLTPGKVKNSKKGSSKSSAKGATARVNLH